MVSIFGMAYYLLERFQGTPRTLIECLYFVWITMASIGYTDEGFTGGTFIRLVTIIVGIYLVTRFIILSAHIYARVVVEEVYNLKVLNEMRKSLERAEGHFIIFGDDRELINKIIQGLVEQHDVYLVSEDIKLLQEFKDMYKALKYIVAKPSSAETVDLLRPEAAKCAYLLYLEDERNVLLAAMLENRVRVISTFSGDFSHIQRFRRVGVEPISPHFSGGLKMVSVMIRPKSTDFLDRFLFPVDGLLEFRVMPKRIAEGGWQYVPLAQVVDGKIRFDASSNEGTKVLAIGFKDPLSAVRKLGRLEAPDLPVRTDKFLVLGGGTIGNTIIEELIATRREIIIVEPVAAKIDSLQKRFGKDGLEFHLGTGLGKDYSLEQFDAVAICTPYDEKNFALGLDFVDTPLLRIVRAVDDDMEFHYRRIGAIPVFVGKVGSDRMLREVTNKYVNEVLHQMLTQSYRIDQVFITKTCTLRELKENFPIRAIALCRENNCFFGVEDEEELQDGDTLIVCGHVDLNKSLRIHHRLED
ncbi:MAG TPA: NAD-binding protein [archaeon]|nr:NAD-binding protein [archaeon]